MSGSTGHLLELRLLLGAAVLGAGAIIVLTTLNLDGFCESWHRPTAHVPARRGICCPLKQCRPTMDGGDADPAFKSMRRCIQ